MTMPISCPITCSCQCAGGAQDDDASASGSQGGQRPSQTSAITAQPQSLRTVTTTAGGTDNPPTLGGFITEAGNAASRIINSQRTQNSLNICYDYCDPWCTSICPSWLRCIFQACCACCINEDPDEGPSESVRFCEGLRAQYGGVVLGMAVGAAGFNVMTAVSEGLTDSQKETLEELCRQYKSTYECLLQKSLAEPLLKTIQTLDPDSPTTRQLLAAAAQAVTRAHQNPSGRLCTNVTITLEDETPSHNPQETHHPHAVGLNWLSFCQKIKYIDVEDSDDSTRAGSKTSQVSDASLLTSTSAAPLGMQGRTVKTILATMVNDTVAQPTHLLKLPGGGVCFSHTLFLKMTLIATLAAGFIPASEKLTTGERRKLLTIKKELADMIAQQQSEDLTDTLDGAVGGAVGGAVESPLSPESIKSFPGGGSSVPGSLFEEICLDDGDDDDLSLLSGISPQDQEQLISTCSRVSHLAASLFL